MICAPRILERCDALARCSETPDKLTRVYLSSEMRVASALALDWMREAGMTVHTDVIGNVCGRYEGAKPGLPALLLGSHLDTVRDAGKYDGMLVFVHRSGCRMASSITGDWRLTPAAWKALAELDPAFRR